MYIYLDILCLIKNFYDKKYLIYLYEKDGWFAWYNKYTEKIIFSTMFTYKEHNPSCEIINLKKGYSNMFDVDSNYLSKKYFDIKKQKNLDKYFNLGLIKIPLYKISSVTNIKRDTLYEIQCYLNSITRKEQRIETTKFISKLEKKAYVLFFD